MKFNDKLNDTYRNINIFTFVRMYFIL